TALLRLGWGRTKRFLATFMSASLLFGSAGAPAALAWDNNSSNPPVGSADWMHQLQSAINFGYENQILLLFLTLNQTNHNNVTNNNHDNNNNNNTNNNNVSPTITVNPVINVTPTITNNNDNSSSSNSNNSNTF